MPSLNHILLLSYLGLLQMMLLHDTLDLLSLLSIVLVLKQEHISSLNLKVESVLQLVRLL